MRNFSVMIFLGLSLYSEFGLTDENCGDGYTMLNGGCVSDDFARDAAPTPGSTRNTSPSSEETTSSSSYSPNLPEPTMGQKDLDSRIAAIKREMGDKYSNENVKRMANTELSTCISYEQNANNKCNLVTPETMMLLGIATNIGGAAASGTSVKAKCEAAGYVNSLGLMGNATLGGVCLDAAGDCLSTSQSKPKSCRNLDDKYTKDMNYWQSEIDAYCERVVNLSSKQNMSQVEANVRGCDNARGEYKKAEVIQARAREIGAKCASYKANSYRYLMQAAASAASVAGSAACVSQAKDAENLANKYATGNSCDDPFKRQTPDCICRDPVQMQQNSLCAGYVPGGAGGAGAIPPIAGTGGVAGTGINPLDDVKKPNGKVGADGPGTQTRNEGIGGGSSGGPQGGSGSSLNPEENGGAAPEYNTNVDQGYQRSKGGTGDGGGSMFGANRGGYMGGGSAEKKPGFDLSKYMPWMNKKSGPDRQIAEINKLKADGVTGAGGPSIWEKVSNRMRAIRPRLE